MLYLGTGNDLTLEPPALGGQRKESYGART